MKPARRFQTKTAIRYALLTVGVLVFAYFIATVDVALVLSSLRGAGMGYMAGAVAASLLNIGVKALRWQWMVSRVSSVRMSVGISVGSIYAGVASASLVPGKAVDFAKPLIAKGSYDVPLTNSTTAMLIERVADTVVVALIFLASVPFIPGVRGTIVQSVLVPVAGVFTLVVFLGLVFRRQAERLLKALVAWLPPEKRVSASLSRIVDGSMKSLSASTDRTGLALLLILSLAAMVLEVVRFFLVLLSLGVHVSLPAVGLLYTASILVSFVSFVPGGVGVTEAFQSASLQLLVAAGPAREVAKGAVLIDRVISYYLVVAIGAILLMWYQRSYAGSEKGLEGSV